MYKKKVTQIDKYMNFTEISNCRLINQQIIQSKFNSPQQIVGWMGAMQAQDFNMAKWAIGVRLPNSTNQLIESAIDNADIIRTHALRPTWHFVSSDDIYWILELTAPNIRATLKTRDKQLGLTEDIYIKSNSFLEKILQNNNHLTRDELTDELNNINIPIKDFRNYHIFLRAELDGIICSGKSKGAKQTYALLKERVPKQKSINRDIALARLAEKYFTSHCPATVQDFNWWSGLNISDSRKALEMIKSKFISETIENQTYWLPNSFSIPKIENDLIYFLPAFDEFIISYKNRTPSIPKDNYSRAIYTNGIFKPIIVKNGQVIGLWKRTIKKDKLIVETELFEKFNNSIKQSIEQAINPFGIFLDKEVEVIHKH